MTKLRYEGAWFFQLSPAALPETDFENLLIQNGEVFRADSWVIPYKPVIYSADSSARPDLAIIDHQYRDWFVVEVEMRRHSLIGHVLPQVRTLRDGYYGSNEAEYIIARRPDLDAAKVRDLMLGTSPQIVTVADRSDEGWRSTLNGAGIIFMTMEIFKSELNQYIFAVNGGVPQRANDLVTYCRFNAMLPRQMIVESPGSLGVGNGERISVLWEGQMIEWVRMDVRDSCYLRTRGSISLKPGLKYALLRQEDGTLSLIVEAGGGHG